MNRLFRLGGLPVAFAAALLLRVARVVTSIAGFAEVAWEMLFWSGSAVGEADMVPVSGLVGASHCEARLAHHHTVGSPLRAIGLERWQQSSPDLASNAQAVTGGQTYWCVGVFGRWDRCKQKCERGETLVCRR